MSWGGKWLYQCTVYHTFYETYGSNIYYVKKKLSLYFDVYLAKSFSLTILNPDIGQEILEIFCWSAR